MEKEINKLVFGCLVTLFLGSIFVVLSFLLIYRYKPQDKIQWLDMESKGDERGRRVRHKPTHRNSREKKPTAQNEWCVLLLVITFCGRFSNSVSIHAISVVMDFWASIQSIYIYRFSWRNARSVRKYERRWNGRKMNSLSIEINWIFNFMSKTYCGLSARK